jgi:hypothetical protein
MLSHVLALAAHPAHVARLLPTFVIVGAMKAGTTTLASWLRGHPDVYVPPRKELHFFDVHFSEGLDWYAGHFEPGARRRARGEATPGYMFKEDAARRMARALPEARLIAVLRNPSSRAYSHYWHFRRAGKETRPFGEVVRTILAADEDAAWRWGGYISRGWYLEQLERLAALYPRERILVLLTEDLAERPRATYATVCEFIGVDPTRVSSRVGLVYPPSRDRDRRCDGLLDALERRRLLPLGVGRRLRAAGMRSTPYPPMDPETRALLLAHYAPRNEALARWLGRDLSHWQR